MVCKKEGVAEKNYRKYVKKGIDEGRRPELVGGGLIRSLGGWSAVKALRRSEGRELSDDRILGSGEFVERIIKEAEANIRYQFSTNNDPEKINESGYLEYPSELILRKCDRICHNHLL